MPIRKVMEQITNISTQTVSDHKFWELFRKMHAAVPLFACDSQQPLFYLQFLFTWVLVRTGRWEKVWLTHFPRFGGSMT